MAVGERVVPGRPHERDAVVRRAGNVVAATREGERVIGAPVGEARFGEVHAACDTRGKLRAAHRDDAVVLDDAGRGAVRILMGELAVATVARGKQDDVRCVDRTERRRREVVDDGTVARRARQRDAEAARRCHRFVADRAVAGSDIGKASFRCGVASVRSDIDRSGRLVARASDDHAGESRAPIDESMHASLHALPPRTAQGSSSRWGRPLACSRRINDRTSRRAVAG